MKTSASHRASRTVAPIPRRRGETSRGGLVLMLWLAFLALAPVSGASAQPAVGADLVMTPGGGRLRGTVTEYEPGVRVVIVMADGTTRTLGPTEFTTVSFGDDAVAAHDAPPPERPPAETLPEAGTAPSEAEPERWSEPRAYSSTRAAEWTNPARALDERVPHGGLHGGIQLDGGFAVAAGSGVAIAPMLSAYGFLDVVLDFDQTFRVGLVGDYLAETASGCTGCPVGFNGGPSLAVRALFGADIGDSAQSNILTFRAGGEIGVSFPPAGSDPGLAVLGRFELALRLLERRTLEIGIAVFGGIRPRTEAGPRTFPGVVIPSASLFLGWVFE
jgi:hypothetical protein